MPFFLLLICLLLVCFSRFKHRTFPTLQTELGFALLRTRPRSQLKRAMVVKADDPQSGDRALSYVPWPHEGYNQIDGNMKGSQSQVYRCFNIRVRKVVQIQCWALQKDGLWHRKDNQHGPAGRRYLRWALKVSNNVSKWRQRRNIPLKRNSIGWWEVGNY
jgi:hypothetical protein